MPAGTGEILDLAWMGDKLVVTYWSPWTLVYDREFNVLAKILSVCGINSWDIGMDADETSAWLLVALSNLIYQCVPQN
jgi:hypothetical protein